MSGYLKIHKHEIGTDKYGEWQESYELVMTNYEVKVMFRRIKVLIG